MEKYFFEYLDYMKDPTVYGTEYDILLLDCPPLFYLETVWV